MVLTTGLKRMRRGMAPAIIGFMLAACGDAPNAPAGNPQNGQNAATSLDPANPGADYVVVTDPGEQGTLIQQMWTTLTGPNCWDATTVLPVGHVSQFQFSGQNQYRHFGFTINFGAIALHSVGHYKGMAAAILETWTGVLEGLVIVNGSTIAHAFPNPANTALVVTQYGASSGPCL